MSEQNIGTVVQITGPVLDIKFAADALPKLLNAKIGRASCRERV